MSHARRKRVGPDVPHLTGLGLLGGRHWGEVAHHGLAAGLAVDRPGGAMIVRRARLGAGIDMRKNAKAELGILVKDLALRQIVADMLGDEGLVLQHVLHPAAQFLASGAAGLRRKDATAFGGELLERMGHGPPPYSPDLMVTSAMPLTPLQASTSLPSRVGIMLRTTP